MHKRLFILHLFLFVFIFSSFAQYEGGISLRDGTYRGHLLINNQPEANITQIKQISLGNGIQVYMDAEKENYLNDTYYIFLGGGGGLYGIANISKGLLHGEYIVYSHGNLWRKMVYNRGVLEGKRYEYYDNGSVKSIIEYKNSIPIQAVLYHNNGQLQGNITYDEFGNRHGQVIVYDANGIIIEESNYENGKLHGKNMKQIGSKSKEIKHYNNNILEGEYTLLYSDGKTQIHGFYDEKSERTSKWSEYWENGSLKSVIIYEKGYQNGNSTFYFENGNIKSYEEYKEGKRHGKLQEYQEYPYHLITDAVYKDGSLDGEYKAYNDGKLWRDCIYKDGVIVSEKQYKNGKIHILRMLDESGNLVDVRKYDTSGKSVYKNQKYRKHDSVRLIEDDFGIIDIE